LPIEQLIAELSQGVEFDRSYFKPNLTLAPVYWTTPLLLFLEIDPSTLLILFGGRPPGDSLIPGETVPEGLMKALKALSDPTRLRILRYLSEQPQTPSQLARKLRLRAPTVTHHLAELRLAGLVQISVQKDTRLYAPRKGFLEQLCRSFEQFLDSENTAQGE
jgi:DNA-binding transcriptional ArsR family regulator